MHDEDGRASHSPLEPSEETRALVMDHTRKLIDNYLNALPTLPVALDFAPSEMRERLARYDFAEALEPISVIEDTVELLTRAIVHTNHPRYLGLFNPTPSFMGVVGELLAAAFNPQLAVWSHAAAANEIERHLIDFLGTRVGLPRESVVGTFTTGGAEANLTAVLVALTRTFPEVATGGMRAVPGQPVMYASEQSHLAWLKIAHVCGLGRDAVRLVPVGRDLRMDIGALRRLIDDDRAAGRAPFLAVATAGTTGTGVVDPLAETADVCDEFGLGFHVDAAWGGAIVLSDRLRPWMAGIERADSVTIDAHKWLSVPMGAGMFLCRDQSALNETFRIATAYMPHTTPDTLDPYTHSIQWSRRFIGLKFFLTLAAVGRTGYAEQIERDCALGDELRALLRADGWEILNYTPLPVVCFRHERADPASSQPLHEAIVRHVVDSGTAWISTTNIGEITAIRACITSYRTGHEDLVVVRDALSAARTQVRGIGTPRRVD